MTYDLIVIGSGPAGEKGAAQAAYFDKKVALVEEAPSYGGSVANTGVPSKAMRETALYLSGFRQRDLHGLTLAYDRTPSVDRFMHRGRVVRQALNEWIGANLDRHHVDVHHGRAAFVDAHTVAVETETGARRLEAASSLSPPAQLLTGRPRSRSARRVCTTRTPSYGWNGCRAR